MIYPGFLLVGAMSLGIGPSICTPGAARSSPDGPPCESWNARAAVGGSPRSRTLWNYAGAIFVTLVGLVSFVALFDTPMR